MAAISRRGQGGRIYNNTRARVLLRRMCVKLADLTTHSPAEDLRSPPHSDTPSPSTSDRPRNADARPQAVRCTPRRPHNPFPPKTFAHPRTATRPSRALPLAPSVLTHAHAAPTHARRLRDARPPTAQPIPRTASRCLPFRSASGTKKRHRTVHVRCRMSRSTVVAVGHLGW